MKYHSKAKWASDEWIEKVVNTWGSGPHLYWRRRQQPTEDPEPKMNWAVLIADWVKYDPKRAIFWFRYWQRRQGWISLYTSVLNRQRYRYVWMHRRLYTRRNESLGSFLIRNKLKILYGSG